MARFSAGGWRRGLAAFVAGVVWWLAAFGSPTWAQPAFRHVNQWLEQQIRYADWKQARSDHFSIRYLPADEPVVPLVLAEAERVYAWFAEQFQFISDEAVPLILYGEDGQMQERFGWSGEEKASGVYYGGVIYLLSPRVLWPEMPATALKDGRLAERYHREGPLPHEYAHLYLDAVANSNFPRWYTEGLAQLIEYEWIGYEWLNDDNHLHRQSLYSLRQLNEQFDRLANVALAYRQAFKFVQFMVREHGETSLRAFHRQLAQAVSFERAWQAVFGEPVEQSYGRWLDDVRRGGYR